VEFFRRSARRPSDKTDGMESRRLVVPFAALLLAACSGPGFRAHVGYIEAALSGDLGLASDSLPAGGGNPIGVDLDQALGLEDESGSLYARAEVDAGPLRVSGSAFRFSETGTGRLTADFGSISVGTDVRSDIDFTNARLALAFDLLDIPYLRLSPGIGVDVFDIDASVQATAGGPEERIDEILPIPMVLVQGEVDLDPFGLTVDAGGLTFDVSDWDATFFDLEAMATFSPVDHVELFVGYRFILLDVDGESGGDEFTADLEIRGFFVGGGLRF